jgi:NitT/TauT family transport system substrate-binding protein
MNHLKFLFLFIFINPLSSAYSENIVRIGTTPAIGTLVDIATQEGIFEKNGLKVKLVVLNSGKLVADALTSNDVDFGTIVDSNIAFNGFNGTNIRVPLILGSRLADGFYFKKSQNINSAKDLIGKKIGFVPGTSGHIYLARYLNKNSVKWEQIKPVTIQPQSAQISLRMDAVDALVIWQPWSNSILKEFGDGVGEILNNKDIYPSNVYLGSTEEYIKKNSDISEKIMKSLKEAELLYETNPSKTYPYLAKTLKVEESEVKNVLNGYAFDVENSNFPLELIKEIGTWIIDTQAGFKDKQLPDYEKLFLK